MSEKEFYLLALDRPWDDLAWWGPNRAGYTRNLEDAGVYSESEARSLVGRDGDPVPVEVNEARSHATTKTTIARDGAMIERFQRSWGSRR